MTPIEAQTEILRHSPWVILLVFLGGGIALLISAWLLRSGRKRRLGWGLLVIGFVAEVVLGPGLINDRISISPTSFQLRVGFWFAPSEWRFDYKDVDFITDAYRTDVKGRRRPIWNVQLKGGQTLEVPQGDLWRKHRERVLLRLKQYGVPFR